MHEVVRSNAQHNRKRNREKRAYHFKSDGNYKAIEFCFVVFCVVIPTIGYF